MKEDLLFITLNDFQTEAGEQIQEFTLSYQVFGKSLKDAPIVLVNHALTGNSTVIGEQGWFNGLCGEGKLIDTDHFSILSFDIPGNGYSNHPDALLERFDRFTARDVASLFAKAVFQLGITELFAVTGGSLGGSIGWEMACLYPFLIQNLIPIACDWKATDWIIANNRVQQQILKNSVNPLQDVRMFSMLFFRTPQSFVHRFNRSINQELGIYNVESWLLHHGKKLEGRFLLQSYKTMIHLLNSVDITRGRGYFTDVVREIESKIILVGIEGDLLFPPETIRECLPKLHDQNIEADYREIKTPHGHDAFLIEFDQMTEMLSDVFTFPANKTFRILN
jgi:homoserine O-acetyltransferase